MDGCRHLAHAHTAVSHRFPETRRPARRASTRERHGSHGRAAARHREQLLMELHKGHAMCLCLALLKARYRRRCTFCSLQASGSFLFGVRVQVARKFSWRAEPRSFDVPRSCKTQHADTLSVSDGELALGNSCLSGFGIGGETSDAVLVWARNRTSYMYHHQGPRAAGSAPALHKELRAVACIVLTARRAARMGEILPTC